jgi:hypothetical protein
MGSAGTMENGFPKIGNPLSFASAESRSSFGFFFEMCQSSCIVLLAYFPKMEIGL